MENLQYYYDLVEKCIGNQGVDTPLCRGDNTGNGV